MLEYFWKTLKCLWLGHDWEQPTRYGDLWCRRCGALEEFKQCAHCAWPTGCAAYGSCRKVYDNENC